MSNALIGKLIRHDVAGNKAYRVSRVIAEVGPGYVLARRLSPHTGKDLIPSHILSLMSMEGPDLNVEIYDDWASLILHLEGPQSDPPVKLVRLNPGK